MRAVVAGVLVYHGDAAARGLRSGCAREEDGVWLGTCMVTRTAIEAQKVRCEYRKGMAGYCCCFGCKQGD